jgi:hypothetical protein
MRLRLKENFDRFKVLFLNLQGELRMADFKKYALAAAGVACFLGFTGVAGAQTTNGINCTANAATPLQARAEGITENVGDVVLSCQGGTVTPLNVAVPTVNVTVALNTQVTSRLLGTSLTDSLLLINDPAPPGQILCPASINNACSTIILGTGNGGGKLNGQYVTTPNVYQGILTASNTLTFFNVPIDAPGTGTPTNGPYTAVGQPTLTLRITNVRANASALGAPTGFSSTTVTEFISTSAGFTISNPSQTVANVLTGLVSKSVGGASTSTAASIAGGLAYSSGSAPTLTQCSSNSLSSTSVTAALVEYVNFTEGFASATKQKFALTGAASEGLPGNATNAESNFLLNGIPTTYGVSDFATRVRVVFGGLPTGVTIYVPTTLPSNTTVGGGVLGSATGLVPTEYMQLTTAAAGSETTAFAQATAATTSTLPGLSSLASGYATVASYYGGWFAPVITSGGAEAVYEVTSQATVSPNTIESFSVPVLVTYSASPATGSPSLGSTTVTVDFAPISAVVTAAASPIPRFISTSANLTGFSIVGCVTNLLFPFVTNQAGFDTGLAIAATSQDPFGTSLQSGTCTLNFYGAGAPAAFTTPTVTAGTVYTTLASTVAAGFQGYLIAQCKFQFAHGFAFITDGFGGPGRGLSEGYLPLIIPNGTSTSRASAGSGENLNN